MFSKGDFSNHFLTVAGLFEADYRKEWNLLLWIARQNIPTALCKGGGDFGSCHLTYSFKKSLMASDNDLPSARAFACALRHS